MRWRYNKNLSCQVLDKFPHISGYRALRIPTDVDVKKILKTQLALSATDGEYPELVFLLEWIFSWPLLFTLSPSTKGRHGLVLNRTRTSYRCYGYPSGRCFGWFVCLRRPAWRECNKRWCFYQPLGTYSTGIVLFIFLLFSNNCESACCMDASEVLNLNTGSAGTFRTVTATVQMSQTNWIL